MPRFPLVGSSSTPISSNFDSQETINLYPELIESGVGKNNLGLVGTPGLSVFSILGEGPVWGSLVIPGNVPANDRLFVVSGTKLYEIDSAGGSTEIGFVGDSDGEDAYLAYNGKDAEMFIAHGGKGWIYDLETSTLSGPVTDSESAELEPITVVFIDGYFVIIQKDSQVLQYSALYDATTWDVLSFFSSEGHPDNAVALLADHRELWAFGERSIQVYFNSGDADNPFLPVSGGFLEQGCWARHSPAKIDNSIFWLGGDDRGNNIAWRADGYNPTRVSTHAIEHDMRTYSRTDDARGLVYTEEGHAFYGLTFPGANKPSLYHDVAMPREHSWHKRACWNTVTGAYEAHHAWRHAWAFGKHVMGDRGSECCVRAAYEGPDPPPEEPPPLVPPCGSMADFHWEHNMRVGPFFHPTTPAKVTVIGSDPLGGGSIPASSTQRLQAFTSEDYGATWALTDDVYPILDGTLRAADCYQVGTDILVATQEGDDNDGRVAYSRFSQVSKTWEVLDVEVSVPGAGFAAHSLEEVSVAITQRSTGETVVWYQIVAEEISAVDYRRAAWRQTSNDGTTWTSQATMGHVGIETNDTVGRAIPGPGGRVHFMFGEADADTDPSGWNGKYFTQTLRGDNTLSGVADVKLGGLVLRIFTGRWSEYAVWEEGGQTRIAIVGRMGASLALWVFTSDDNMAAADVSELYSPADEGCYYGNSDPSAPGTPQAHVHWDNGTLYVVAAEYYTNRLNMTLYQKTLTTPYTSMGPAAFGDDQIGPVHTGGADDCIGVKYVTIDSVLYVAWVHRVGGAPGVIYDMQKVSELPSEQSYAEWSADCVT